MTHELSSRPSVANTLVVALTSRGPHRDARGRVAGLRAVVDGAARALMGGWGGRRARVAALAGLLLLPPAVTAQDNPDTQVWVQVLALGQIGDDWRTHVEVQPRFMNDASELGLTIVRTAVGRRVAPRLTAWLGHAWVPRTLGAGVRHEQRIWQQLSFAGPAFGRWTPSARLRIEQRWLEPWVGVSHRVRLLARAQRPLRPGSAWGLFTYDEVMITLDRTPRGPARGVDRNRLSGGLSRRLSAVASTDLGYIWETATIAGGRRNDHMLSVVLNLNAPR